MIILIVDDSKVMQKTLHRLLLRCSVPMENIQTADDGSEAVELVRNTRPSFGLIMMDQNMPGITGDIATGMIRQVEIELGLERSTIITCSTSETKAFPEADGILAKPVDKEELQRLLDRVASVRMRSRRVDADEKLPEEPASVPAPTATLGDVPPADPSRLRLFDRLVPLASIDEEDKDQDESPKT